MTIAEMHDMLKDLKNQGQGGYDPPEVIDRALNNASLDKFNQEKRLFEANSFISDNLAAFRTSTDLTFTAGFAALPAGYDYRTNAETTEDPAIEVEIVPEAEWVKRKRDPIDVPSTTRPICSIRDQVEVYPASVSEIKLYHLRRPVTMLFDYSYDSNGNVIQSVGSSVDCDWNLSAHVDIVRRAAGYLGIPLNDESLVRLESFKTQNEAA